MFRKTCALQMDFINLRLIYDVLWEDCRGSAWKLIFGNILEFDFIFLTKNNFSQFKKHRNVSNIAKGPGNCVLLPK